VDHSVVTGSSFQSAVVVSGLNVSFGGSPVLHIDEAWIAAASLTVVLGRSGSGKTTFLRSLNRLNECFPGCTTTGQVRLLLQGRMLEAYGPTAPDLSWLRRRAGMVFQSPNVLPMSVERNIALPLQLVNGLSGGQIRERVERALREAQLWDEVKDRMGSPASSLSGGQQQRLCLARTLALEPEILLLDEPTASVDHASARRIEELLLQLKERYTLVVVSHGLGQTRRLADRVLLFREGSVVETIGREECCETGRLEELIGE
jgi:phosphate transport system ATP-binding protein